MINAAVRVYRKVNGEDKLVQMYSYSCAALPRIGEKIVTYTGRDNQKRKTHIVTDIEHAFHYEDYNPMSSITINVNLME